MACSLEGRSPLLDHELFQFAASLPPELKVNGREKKVALRKAMRGWLPDEILDAPKRGFQPPIVDWLRGPLREHAREMLLDQTARERNWFRSDRVERLLDEHARGAADHSQGLWTLLVLETWMRDVVEAPPAAAAAPVAG
jgi:asparagine synthase (glutamine-hydrolysing)